VAGERVARYHSTPAADARNRIRGEIRSQSLTNVAMKVVEVTCLSVSRTDPVKLLRLMSSIIGWSASNPRGGRFRVVELPWGETAKSTAGDSNLLEQFAVPDPDEEYPVVPLVEGSSEDKMEAIRRSDYLSFAYERLSHVSRPLTIFGHSLGDEDRHLSEAIVKADDERPIAISVRASSEEQVARRKLELMKTFTKADLRFFDAATHPLGNPEISVG